MSDALKKLHNAIESRLNDEVTEEVDGLTGDMARLGSLKALARNMMEMDNKENKVGYLMQSLMLLAATLVETPNPEEFYIFTTDLILILPNQEDQLIARACAAKVFKGMMIHATGKDIFSDVVAHLTGMVNNMEDGEDDERQERMLKAIRETKKGSK